MIKFENTNYLFLLLLLLPIIFFKFKNLRKFKREYKNFPNAKRILRRSNIRMLFFCLSWIFLVLAMACPLWGSKPVSVRQRGSSVIFVSDISRSMTVSDILPNRMAVQKQFLKILINKLEKSLCGLVITKGDGVLTIPLSFEKNALISAVDSLSPKMLSSSGTNLEAGLIRAINSFGENHAGSKIIILCTDGEETNGNLLNAINAIKKTTAILIIAGFGTSEGGNISIIDENGEKKLKKSKLNEKKLEELALKAGKDSIYINACSFASIETVLEKIETQDKSEEKMVYIQEPVKRNFEMLLISFIFIIIGVMSFYDKKN